MSDSIRTMQPDDLFELQFINGAELSPDGTHVAYFVLHVDTEKDKEFSTIYVLDIASGAIRQMTNGEARDTNPRWSPDGQSIAFSSTRKEKPQLFILPVDGGEARQITYMKQGVGGFAWSPDGSQIAFTAKPDFGDTPPNLSKDVYRVDRTIYRFDAMGYLHTLIEDLYVLDVESGTVKQLTHDNTNNFNPIWSPDGTKILYLANMYPDRIAAMYPSINMIDLDGNIEVVLDGWNAVTGINFTPDGNKIAFVGMPDEGQPIGTKWDLHVLNLASGQIENRSAGLAVGVGGGLSADMPATNMRTWRVLVSSDGEAGFVPVQAGGTVHIYKIGLSGAEKYEAITSGDNASVAWDIRGDCLLYAQMTMNTPADLFLANLYNDNSTQLTDINADYLAQISLPESVHLLFDGVDGTQVEGWYMKPPVGEAPYPTILYIHGGPHGAYGHAFHSDFHILAGAGYGVVFINHRASTGYGDSFSTAIKGDWGNLDYNDLMSGVDYAIEQGLADADHMGVCGLSGGGNLSCWIIGQTDRFKAAIPQNPVTNWRSFYGTSDIGIWFSLEQLGGHPHEIPVIYEKCSPITYAHNCKTPTLMVQCEHDWRCPAEQSEQFYTVLKANGCTVEMLRQPGGSHTGSMHGAINLRREHNEAMLDWFARYV